MSASTLTALIDYGCGNLHSAERALRASGATDLYVGADPEHLRKAQRYVLPGVGALGACLEKLRAKKGLLETLNEQAAEKGKPLLGICVGMQMFVEQGFEHGRQRALGWMKGSVRRIAPQDESLPIPHTGWNALNILAPHPLFEGIKTGDPVYFVHSFAVSENDPRTTLAQTCYGDNIVAAIGQGSLVGVQWHPEKSQRVGLRLLANFLAWKP